MEKAELGKKIYRASYLEGEFRLRSGKVSQEYFDKYQFESDPYLLREITVFLSELVPPHTEVLAGLEMGGIPLATSLSLHTGLPQVMVRKEAKSYGTEKIAEGVSVDGRDVLIIEDVVTTGGQIVLSTNELRKKGADIQYALCVIERNTDGKIHLQQNGIQLLSLFTADALKKG